MAENAIYPSDETLLDLNQSICTALREYVSEEEAVIRFDLPEPETLPDVPTVSVFLYDIQEDLQLRHGETRKYAPASGQLLPGRVHIRCCYLITYWEPKQAEGSDSPAAGPRSNSIVRLNCVLNALLNTPVLPDLPGSYTRVIPPSEELNSLGNFWQSLGNKPRLSLSYAVTVPVRLTDKNEKYLPIREMTAALALKPEGNLLQQVEDTLWQTLYAALDDPSTASGQSMALQLRKVDIRCTPMQSDIEGGQKVSLVLSGVANSDVRLNIEQVANAWVSDTNPACVIGDMEIFVGKVDISQLETVASLA